MTKLWDYTRDGYTVPDGDYTAELEQKSIQDLVIEDMEDRKALGMEKYGKLLYKDTRAKKVTAYIPQKEQVLH